MRTTPASNRTAISATATGDGSTWPERAIVTIAGVAYLVDVTVDRDDWQLPEVDDAIAHLVAGAVDDAIEAWHRDNEPEVTRQERTWARRAA